MNKRKPRLRSFSAEASVQALQMHHQQDDSESPSQNSSNQHNYNNNGKLSILYEDNSTATDQMSLLDPALQAARFVRAGNYSLPELESENESENT
jgi:hypothetical protein